MKTLFAEAPAPKLNLKEAAPLNWPFLLLITAITMVGVAALYSVAGGALEPWASRHVVRYCFGLALLFAIALSDIRWWLRAAYPLYLVALLMLRVMSSAWKAGAPSAGWAMASSASSPPR